MPWQQALQNHLQMLGDWWVAGDMRASAPLAPYVQSAMQRKKQELESCTAEIEAVAFGAKVGHIEQKREDTVIDYQLASRWLIGQCGDFYIEERLEERQALVRGGRIVDDHLLPLFEEEPLVTQVSTDAPARRNSYDRALAVRYAELWWNARNPAFPRIENDCTNYVSQCLFAGGIAMWGAPVRGRGWWHQQTNWSFSWAVANSLRWYLSRSANIIGAIERESADQLVPGDVICYDFEGDGHWNHNTFVTAMDPAGEPLVNAHTYDVRNRPWAYRDSPAWTANIQYKFFHIEDG
ncbi:MAG: amidase domain-containing protein [Sporolactobacillus sp.]